MDSLVQPIDAHAHVASPDAERFPRSDVFPRAPRFNAPVESLLADMDTAGVARAVLIQPSLYGFDHAYLLACLRAHPDRFVGLALANPADQGFADALIDMARDAPIAGVRFAPLIDSSLPWFSQAAEGLARVLANLDMTVGLLLAPTHLDSATAWITRWPQIGLRLRGPRAGRRGGRPLHRDQRRLLLDISAMDLRLRRSRDRQMSGEVRITADFLIDGSGAAAREGAEICLRDGRFASVPSRKAPETARWRSRVAPCCRG